MALHDVRVGVVSVDDLLTVDDLPGMQQQQQSVCGPTAHCTRSHACTKA